LKRWIDRYEKTGSIQRKNRDTSSYKITKEHIIFIKRIIKEKPDIRMIDLHGKLATKFPKLTISRQYLSDILRDNNITRKRATFEHFPKTYRGKERDEEKELDDFFKQVKKFSLNNIIAIDETSLSTSLSFNYCRNYLGKRCRLKTDNNSVFQKYSLLVAISNKKCIGMELYDKGSVNFDRFNKFLKKICDKYENKLIILDNGKIHKTETTKKIIEKSGNHILYTCPYHPRLNAIEQFFNQLKHYIKIDKPMSLNKLKESLINSVNKIKSENYKNYFIYAYDKNQYKGKSKESSKHHILKSIKIKTRHLKYAPL
jgi:transposase